MYNHSKGEWKPKKIVLNDNYIVYTIWVHDNLTLNLKSNKPPLQLIKPIILPDNKVDSDFVTDADEVEANIVLMANAKVLLEALKLIQQETEQLSIHVIAEDAIK